MRLLSLSQVKKEKKQVETESVKRSIKIREQETYWSKKLNDTKKTYEDYKAKVDGWIVELETLYRDRKSTLMNEISSLESERKELMKPITQLRKDANTQLKKNIKKSEELHKFEGDLKEEKLNLTDKVIELNDRQEEIEESEANLLKRKEIVRSEEEQVKDSLHNLGEKWEEYHTTVNKRNLALDTRERELTNKELTLSGRAKMLDTKETALNREQIRLIDSFSSLDMAMKEFEAKKNNK